MRSYPGAILIGNRIREARTAAYAGVHLVYDLCIYRPPPTARITIIHSMPAPEQGSASHVKMPATGSLVLVHNQMAGLLPQFYVMVALILAGFKVLAGSPPLQLISVYVQEGAGIWRGALLGSQIVTICIEAAWSWLHPQALPRYACAAGLLLAAFSSTANVIFVLREDVEYTWAFGLHVLTGLACLPTSQMGNLHVLNSVKSQARYRMIGWILTLVLGTVVLLLPDVLAQPSIICLVTAAPALLMAVLLLVLAPLQDPDPDPDPDLNPIINTSEQ